MRFCGCFWLGHDVLGTKKRLKAYRMTGQSVGSPLLPIDLADRRPHGQARLPECLNRLEQGTAGGNDVLDEAHALAFLVRPFDAIRGAVILRSLADDQERKAGGKRARRRQCDGAELGRSKADGVRLERLDGPRDPLAQRCEGVGSGLEAVLVEVIRRSLGGAQEEVALEIGV